MNCILYARVSTDRQAKQDLSIPAQIEAMRQYASNKKWQIAGEFIEEGKSGTTMKRPELNRLLEYCKKHKNVNSVVVHKLDRFARNLVDYTMIRSILKKSDIRLISVVENFEDSISGHLVENIMASIAEFYSANLGEEVKKGALAKIKQGGWPQFAPPGYKNVRGDDGKAALVIDEEKAPLVREAFRKYSTGRHSLKEIAFELHENRYKTKIGKPLSPENVKRMLQRKFYTGVMTWNGVEYEGDYEPIIDLTLFNQVQTVLNERRKDSGEKGKLHFLLRGITFCRTCGAKITAERHPRGNYYRCIPRLGQAPCSEPYIPTSELDGQLMEIYQNLELSPEFIRFMRKRIENRVKEMEQRKRRELAPLKRKQKELQALKLKIAELLAKGRIENEVYNQLKDKYNEEIIVTESRLYVLSVDVSSLIDIFDKSIAVACSLYEIHKKFKFQQRKKLLLAVLKRVEVENRRIVYLEFNPPFNFIFSSHFSGKFENHLKKEPETKLERVSTCPKTNNLLEFTVGGAFKSVLFQPAVMLRNKFFVADS